MASLRNKRKREAMNGENHKKSSKTNQSRDTSVPRTQEDYLSQASDEIEERVTEKLSQEFSWTESRIMGLCPS